MTDYTANFASASCRRPQGSLIARAFHALAVQAQRRQLAKMGDDQLIDLGLSRAEADAEARRPLWDAPARWKC